TKRVTFSRRQGSICTDFSNLHVTQSPRLPGNPRRCPLLLGLQHIRLGCLLHRHRPRLHIQSAFRHRNTPHPVGNRRAARILSGSRLGNRLLHLVAQNPISRRHG
ncbi:hypothetical protein, partial [uncultured Muribaculum sp.]|uniref:hypothetical protein n=1 Tax=uncultured Muribaculum sp. TaxID=1918613 RepID=UPI0025AE1B02